METVAVFECRGGLILVRMSRDQRGIQINNQRGFEALREDVWVGFGV